MFQILYPLGLFAALGIIIPILIHLWNVRTGKTLKVGSVFLLGAPSNQRSRSFRVQDWPLLLIRCLIIFLVALVLSAPVIYTKEKVVKGQGWILVDKSELPELWNSHRSRLDSLIRAGYEIHDFAPNFEKIDLQDTNTVFSKPHVARLPVNSLIRQLDLSLPQGTSVYVFAKRLLADFEGPQIESRLDLHWEIVPPDSSELKWTAAAFQLQNGRLRKLEANASGNGIYYAVEDKSSAEPQSVAVDTSTITIQIYAGKHAADANYVRAAVTAVAEYTQRKIKVRDVSGINTLTKAPGVLFWLSEEKLSPEILAAVHEQTVVFYYAGSKVQLLSSVVRDNAGVATQPAGLYQRTALDVKAGMARWVDGTGTPLLLPFVQSGINCLGFYSRFKPGWTDMVWSGQLVQYILPIILSDADLEVGFKDAARLPVSISELAHTRRRVQSAAPIEKVVEYGLDTWIWYSLLVAFLAERVISHNRRKVSL